MLENRAGNALGAIDGKSILKRGHMPRKHANALREIHPDCADWMQHSPGLRDTLAKPDGGPAWALAFQALLAYAQRGERLHDYWIPDLAARLLELERIPYGSGFDAPLPAHYDDDVYSRVIAAVRARYAIEMGQGVPRYWLAHLAGCARRTIENACFRGSLRSLDAGNSADEESSSNRRKIDSGDARVRLICPESARAWLASRGVVVHRLCQNGHAL